MLLVHGRHPAVSIHGHWLQLIFQHVLVAAFIGIRSLNWRAKQCMFSNKYYHIIREQKEKCKFLNLRLACEECGQGVWH